LEQETRKQKITAAASPAEKDRFFFMRFIVHQIYKTPVNFLRLPVKNSFTFCRGEVRPADKFNPIFLSRDREVRMKKKTYPLARETPH
jgi:hypothetical protein